MQQYLPPLHLSLPLRYLFSKIPAPKERGPFLDRLLDLFLMQYKSCNEGLSYGTGEGREGEREREGGRERETEREGERYKERKSTCTYMNGVFPLPLSLNPDTLKVLCYSLILLSVDLTSPHVKNKMSKREFIRNLRPTVSGISDDTLGHMYDNIYLSGHVATQDDTGN